MELTGKYLLTQNRANAETRRYRAESGKPMRASEITDVTMNQGYWHSDASIPDATISSAIITEIKRKGERSRFVRVASGLFTVKD